MSILEDAPDWVCDDCDARFAVIMCRDARGFDVCYCPRCGSEVVDQEDEKGG